MATTKAHDEEAKALGCCDCLRCVDAQIQETDDGRYMIAAWSERQAQWQSSDLPKSRREQSYRYTYARSLIGLCSLGIRTYPTRARARAALRAEVQS